MKKFWQREKQREEPEEETRGRNSGKARPKREIRGRNSKPDRTGRDFKKPEAPVAEPIDGPKFGTLLKRLAIQKGLRLEQEPSPLGSLEYADELELKNAALREFWTAHRLPDKPVRLIPSPQPRHYRSTSKRKLVLKGTYRWDFFSERPAQDLPRPKDEWALEPDTHQTIYRLVLEKLNTPAYFPLSRSLNFLIVRGQTELMVIFNVFRMSADIVRKARMLADRLEAEAGVKAVHLFADPTRSSYYLEAGDSGGIPKLKKLLGPEFLPMQVGNIRYFLHPLGFFQVNPALLPRLVEDAYRALKPDKTTRLIDLYCGAGLFTLPLGVGSSQAVGVEMSPVSIQAAKMSAVQSRIHARFVAGKIEPSRLKNLIPPTDGIPEILLMDPPAQGTANGLIRVMAERKPRRVVHFFCNLDILPAEIGRWRKQGYMLAKAVPYDMFPGTDNIEMMVLLLPDTFGILGRIRRNPL